MTEKSAIFDLRWPLGPPRPPERPRRRLRLRGLVKISKPGQIFGQADADRKRSTKEFFTQLVQPETAECHCDAEKVPVGLAQAI